MYRPSSIVIRDGTKIVLESKVTHDDFIVDDENIKFSDGIYLIASDSSLIMTSSDSNLYASYST